MKMTKLGILFLLAVVALVLAQQPQVVATVGDQEITTTDLAIEFNFMNPQQANELLQSNEGKSQVLETVIRRKLLLTEAQNEKLDTLPSTKLLIQRQVEDALLQVKLNQISAKASEPSEEQIQQVYEKNDSIFYAPKSIHVLRIVAPNKEEADIAYASLKGGIDFKKLIERYPGVQENPSGDIGWLAVDNLVPELKNTLTGTKVGNYTEPIEVGGAWQIFYIEGKRDAGKLPLEDVRPQIKQQLQQQLADQTIQQYQDQMMKSANVQVNDQVLQSFGQQQQEQVPAVPPTE